MTAITFPADPSNGELYTAPNGCVYIWDGEKWAVNSTIYTGASLAEITADRVESLFTHGTNNEVNFTYNDASDKIEASLDLSSIAQDIVPDADNTRDLGSPTNQWRHVYTAGGSIYLNNIKLSNVDGKFVATKVINPGEENEAEDPEDSDATSDISSANLGNFKISGGTLGTVEYNNPSGWGSYDLYLDPGFESQAYLYIPGLPGQQAGNSLQIFNKGAANSTVQVFGRGGVQAVTNTGEDEKVFEFRDDGKLQLPPGGDIVDSTGTSVLGGGNASTGDVTFDGVKVIGAGTASGDGSGYSTLELVPDNDLYGNHQYLVIDPTAPSHIHIRAGGTQDNSNAELFLGGEKNYLRVRDNSGSVRMQTQTLQETGSFTFNTTLGFVSATWQSDGNGGYQVFMIEVTPELYNAISNSNSDSFIQLYDGTNYYNVTSTGMTPAVGAVVFGVVQAPDGGGPINIVEINITNFTLRTNYAELNGPDFTVNVYDDVRITGEDVVSIRNRSTTGPITIITDWNDSERTWSFGPNGDLSLPQDGGIVFDRNNTTIRVGMGFHIASGEGISLDAIDQTDPNNLVYKSWGFAPTGILTLPNGSSIESTAGNGIGLTTDRGTILFGNSPEIGGPSHFHIMKPEVTTGVDLYFGDDYNFVLQRGTAYGDDPAYGVEIGANDRNEGGQKRWRFGTDGNLTLPNNSQIRVDGNNVEVGGMTNFNVEALGVVNVYTNDGAHQWQFDDDGSLSVPGSIKNTQTLGGEVVISTASTQGDSAKNWTFSHDGVGDLGLPQESGVSAIKSMNLSTYSPTFQQFVNLKDYDSLSSVDGTDINIINPQPEILALIDPTSPNFIGTAGAKVRIVHGYSLGDFIVTETTLTGPFALNGEDPLVPGVPRYTATIADTGVAASEIRQFGFGDSATWHFKSNGILKLPGGATVKDLLGEGPDDSVLILGAGTTIAENQRAARIGINGSVEGVSIGAGSNDWSFTNDGRLTFPGGMNIATEEGGDTRLIIAGGSNFIDLRSNGTILIGYNSTGSVQIGNPEGGTTTELVSEKVKFLLQSVPTSSVGAAGDTPGLIAFDASYIYYCAGTYNGVNNIWKRVAWSADTW